MAAPTSGLCGDWIDELDCCPGLLPGTDVVRAIAVATNILFRLSGRQFPGLCERTVHPCFGSNCGCCCDGWGIGNGWEWSFIGWPYPTMPMRIDGEWFNIGCCDGKCELPRVRLPMPVADVTEVVVDGIILDPSAYDVQQYRFLRRLDGGVWPCSNDYTKDSSPYAGPPDGSKDGTWEITYVYGREPDEGGKLAVEILACQIAKARCGASDCVLPQRLREIVRDDVTMTFIDPMEFLAGGRTGIYEVDLWLAGVNPAGIQRRMTFKRIGASKNWHERTSPP